MNYINENTAKPNGKAVYFLSSRELGWAPASATSYI